MPKETTEIGYLIGSNPNDENNELHMLCNAMEYIKKFDAGDQEIQQIEINIRMAPKTPPEKKPMTEAQRHQMVTTHEYIDRFLQRKSGPMRENDKNVFVGEFLRLLEIGYGADRLSKEVNMSIDLVSHLTVNLGMINRLLHNYNFEFMLDYNPNGIYCLRSLKLGG